MESRHHHIYQLSLFAFPVVTIITLALNVLDKSFENINTAKSIRLARAIEGQSIEAQSVVLSDVISGFKVSVSPFLILLIFYVYIITEYITSVYWDAIEKRDKDNYHQNIIRVALVILTDVLRVFFLIVLIKSSIEKNGAHIAFISIGLYFLLNLAWNYIVTPNHQYVKSYIYSKKYQKNTFDEVIANFYKAMYKFQVFAFFVLYPVIGFVLILLAIFNVELFLNRSVLIVAILMTIQIVLKKLQWVFLHAITVRDSNGR